MRSPAEEFGPYVVYEQIGLGGMATVHRAETQGIAGFSKQVALKRMLPNVAADANLVRSFIREARLASHLRHANVAQTYDLGKVGDTYFIAMELVPGRNLREILKHHAMVVRHSMPLPIAMNIVNQIADALDYAHNLCDETGQPLGIIHRDVSPANVIVSEGGTVKLIDFGIAKASGGGMQTLTGTIKGKFSYLAPECLLGSVDARSDLFALGVIAYELLTNRPLFQGKDDMDTLGRVKDMPVLPVSHVNPAVPPEIEAIIMTALERDPEKRWQRATAMRQALTTETQRLGLVAHNAQVEAWIDKAFTQTFNEQSEPSIVISRHTVELARGTVSDEFLHDQDDVATIIKPGGSRQLEAQRPQIEPTDEATGEATLTDHPPVQSFEAHTVLAQPDERLLAQSASEWNSPSSVETVHDRPRVDDWNAHDALTREAPAMVERRPTGPHVIQRASASHPSMRAVRSSQPPPSTETHGREQPRRPSSPPAIVQSGAHTVPHLPQHPSAEPLPPNAGPLSGARTSPMMMLEADTATTDVNVSRSQVIAQTDVGSGVGAVLADLEQRSTVGGGLAPRPDRKRRSAAGNFLLAVLVLLAAGGAAAVVYFALPHLT